MKMSADKIEERLAAALGHAFPDWALDGRTQCARNFLDTLGRILALTNTAAGELGSSPRAAAMSALCVAAQTVRIEELQPDEVLVCTTLIEAARALAGDGVAELSGVAPS